MGTSNFPKIAFIGLGVMGREMVRHLITAGYPVKIYDISSDAVSALAEQGGIASDSVATAVYDAQIVISMLPNTPQVEEVVYREGIIDHMPGGGIYIDMSTISPEATRAMASALAAKSIFMLDGPVSGGRLVQGTLHYRSWSEASGLLSNAPKRCSKSWVRP